MFDVFLNNNGSRRDFLRVGAVGGLLSLASAASAVKARRKHRAKNVILAYRGGRLPHHDTFDPKPDAPAEVRGIYKTISTSVPGLTVTEMVPKLAKVMHKLALVRSGAHNNDHHETATNWVMSGRFGSAFGDYPAIGAVVAHET